MSIVRSLENFFRMLLSTSGLDREEFFCRSGSAESREETAGAMFLAADRRLFKFNANMFFTKKGSDHMAASSCTLFVSHASLKGARKLIIEMGSLGSKKYTLIY